MSHFKSKKWSTAVLGSGSVLFVFVVTVAATLCADAQKAAYLAGLANNTTVALSALLTSLVAGQSCVDWRHGSSTNYAAQERQETEEKIERVFAPKHYDDPTVS